MTLRHFVRFNVAGLVGAGVQLASFAALLRTTPLSSGAAASLAVTIAVVHNFFWHWKWTWADLRIPPRAAPAAFARFALSNGAVSLVGTAAMMPLLTGAGIVPFAANAAVLATTGLLNFYLARAIAFRKQANFAERSDLRHRPPAAAVTAPRAGRVPVLRGCGPSSHGRARL